MIDQLNPVLLYIGGVGSTFSGFSDFRDCLAWVFAKMLFDFTPGR
jgi:hypothetical protein